MTFFLKIIALVSLLCSITVLAVAKNHDDTIDKSLPLFGTSPISRSVSKRDVSSLMNPEERGEGGHILTRSDNARTGVSGKLKFWPNATIPYIVNISEMSLQDMIYDAIEIIEYWTCIRFILIVDGANENLFEDYIVIQSFQNGGCKSFVGRQGGAQTINLEYPLCFNKMGTVLHQLLHAIGLIDEHRRPERDRYIKVHDANVIDNEKESFTKFTSEAINDYGVPYDYNSVMHYSEYAYSRNGQKTIESNVPIGQREGMSVRDAITVDKMYECFYYINTTQHYSDVLPNFNETTLSKDELNLIYFKRKIFYE